MTRLLEEAVQRLSTKPEIVQNAIASQIMTRLNSERRWDKLFRSSQDMLSEMAAKALEEDRKNYSVVE